MSHENIKKHCPQKSNCVFLELGRRKLLKVAAFVIFPTSAMVLFEIHQRFKGHVFKELRVSFKEAINQCKSEVCPCHLCQAYTFRLVSCTHFIILEQKLFIFGSEKPFYWGPDTWELVSTQIKKFQSVSYFNKVFSKWKPKSCLCRL